MSGFDLVLRSRRVVLPGGERPAAVCVTGGRIAALAGYADALAAGQDTDLAGQALLPGLVDSHVHVNEPGRTEWEGFATATRAAAAGGVTTLIDMPLNSIPPTLDAAALATKRAAAEGRCAIDVGFWGGAVPDNTASLPELFDGGVFGVKCFLSPSGVDEFPMLDRAGLDRAAAAVAERDGLLLVHAEDPAALTEPKHGPHYRDFLASRPDRAEESAVRTLVEVASRTGVRVHVLHVSAAGVLPILAEARAAGVRLTAETCPHYLTLAAEKIADGDTAAKCCPPVRGAANRDALWQGLASGLLDAVVSDHSPATPALKFPPGGDFATAWGGISSLQLGLPLVWTAARSRGHTLTDVVRWMAAGPADLTGLATKGRIAVGADADLVAFDPDRPVTVDPAALAHRHPVTPYAGHRLTGAVRATWLAGRPVDPSSDPAGRLLTRPTP